MNGEYLDLSQTIYLKLAEKTGRWLNEQRIPGGRTDRDGIVYIIRRSGKKLGLFSYVDTILPRIVYAVEHDYIPVVDMCTFDNSLRRDNKHNPWEDYFEQPGGLSLPEAYASKKIIISDAGVPDDHPSDSAGFLSGSDGRLEYWRMAFRKYIKINSRIMEQADNKYKELFGDGKKILGVLARGTDYVTMKPPGHPIQPDAAHIIEKVSQTLREKGYDRIFLATEDANIANELKNKFGDICVTNDVDYIDYRGSYLADEQNNKQMSAGNKNIDYLINLVLLSRCQGIVAGRTSGTIGAALMSDGWEFSYFFDMGTYPEK
ncbi:MAG: hypothetical protein K5662_05420 [Lachnospiraceae bacterium]|nr:hypothetical protein [Lachnospiraceae bacterium]